jgi:hypothetical protein
MALGNKCPNCGKQTFHKNSPVLVMKGSPVRVRASA